MLNVWKIRQPRKLLACRLVRTRRCGRSLKGHRNDNIPGRNRPLEPGFVARKSSVRRRCRSRFLLLLYTLLSKRKLFIATNFPRWKYIPFLYVGVPHNFPPWWDPMMVPVKQFPMFREIPSHKHEYKTTRQLAAHGDYSISAECWAEIFDIFGIFCCILVFLFIYCTVLPEPLYVFCGTPMVPQNWACKTLLYVDIQYVSSIVPEEEPDSSKDVGRVWLTDRNFKILYCGGLKMHVNLLMPTGYFT